MTTTYSIDVTPRFQGLLGVYDCQVYVTRKAGVCGPAESFTCGADLDELDRCLAVLGYTRTGQFGPVCSNGFASASIDRRIAAAHLTA